MMVKNIAKPLAALALLAGCATEAGIGPENATFGIAYGNNTLIQSAEYQRGAFIGEVSADFAGKVDDTINFDFNRAKLDAASRRALDSQAAWLRENPTVRVRITGHTDLVGGEGYNDRLGLRRARATARYLLRRGVARARIDMVESQGEREPVVATEERERRNRRSVTEVAGFTHGFVGEGMDGRRALLMYRRYVTDTVETPASAATTTASGGGG
ncbi:MAG: OmpA family protein [Pseudomonadota bacterium]